MPKQGKTPKKKSKEKTPQKSGESEYPAMDQDEFNRLFQNAIEQSQAQLQQKHEEQIKRLEADREAKMKVVEERLTRKFDDEVRELSRAFDESRYTSSVQSLRCRPRAKPLATVTATCLGPNLKSAPYASISLIQPVLLKFTRTIK